MKKIGMMEIAFTNGIIVANAKTGMVDLRSIERLGMAISGIDKMENYSKRASLWLELKDTKEFIQELMKLKNSSVRENFLDKVGVKNYKLWANLLVALKYAMYVDKKLEVEVLEVFINNKILDFRLLGIDYNKKLNDTLDTLEDRLGKENKGIYINTSRMIKTKIFGEHHEGWDNEEDEAESQKKRSEIIDRLVGAIEMKYVRTWEGVKEFFNKM